MKNNNNFNSHIKQSYVYILEQDRGLEALGHVIARQKHMALDIGTEVDQQNGKISLVA